MADDDQGSPEATQVDDDFAILAALYPPTTRPPPFTACRLVVVRSPKEAVRTGLPESSTIREGLEFFDAIAVLKLQPEAHRVQVVEIATGNVLARSWADYQVARAARPKDSGPPKVRRKKGKGKACPTKSPSIDPSSASESTPSEPISSSEGWARSNESRQSTGS